MTTDEHLNELARQCMQATPLGRLSMTEALAVFAWLLDGHMTRTGVALERPKLAPRIIAHQADGKPIYEAGADFSTHDTVTMGTPNA
ncbi:hypothetical protein ABH973_006233 [Bradyrhizobium ottawaense]|uniref:hypothetical protein n=1 Tax=Bradyrhizobium ottawaense TaxID=931866 RepID=UPI0035149227